MHAQDIGHAQSTQPNTPMHFFTGSVENAQRTAYLRHAHKISYNMLGAKFQLSLRPDEVQLLVG